MWFWVIILCIIAMPIYAFARMVHSFFPRSVAKMSEDIRARAKILEGLSFIGIFCILTLGLAFDSQGVQGGEPLRVYEQNGVSLEGYASLSGHHVFTLFVFLCLSMVSYWLLSTKKVNLSPVLYTIHCVLLIILILLTIVYLLHTGFLYTDLFESLGIILLQIGLVSLSFFYIARLNESMHSFLEAQEEQEIEHPKAFIAFLSRISDHYRKIPRLWALFLFPVFLVIQLVLVLFGQRPDSSIQAFLETSSFRLSQIPVPPPEMVPGDGHYLCTVSVTGHPGLVRPVRMGIRHGSRIVVNRQLLIANAFEHLLEEYIPTIHKHIRRVYDTYGYPISKHIRTKWSADLVYLLMKPLEWLFLIILYTVDAKPENRIHIQYSGYRNRIFPKK